MHRPLSPLERWYWIADGLSPLNVVGRMTVEGRLDRLTARAALDLLQRSHPALRVAVDETPENGPAFVRSGRPIPLVHREESRERLASSDRWAEDADRRHLAEGVDPRNGPLVRAEVVSAVDGDGRGVHELVLVLHHAIADGTTAISLVRQWAEYAAAAGIPEPRGGSGASEDGSLPPSTEDLFPREYRAGRGEAVAAEKRRRDAEDASRLAPVRVPRQGEVPFEKRRTRLVHRRLDAATTRALITACRSRGVTVHGVLAAGLVEAVHRDAGAPPGTRFAIGSPVDFRAELDPPVGPDEAGTFVATLPTIVAGGADLWETARAVNADLARRRDHGEHFSMINDLAARVGRDVVRSIGLIEYMDREGPINLCLTNVGAVRLPERIGSLRVTGADFAAGISVTGVLVAAATTAHGRLSWNLTYVDGLVSRDRATRLAASSLDLSVAALR
ncbi:phthiocerol/phthiodiolone dimycocerosyl transferase family protein [Nocardiopsis lambiniae]|uniref:Phthiocerol/phthiodiolone dimycocerosyl transferase n=1 Tax=Nocardiopsis lambiniae TaxID=3075539 RepID=A0ABU2MBW0_9ACTN|nr:condensation domain-containing protein [Nocardiopsis sp. DSM 44743]MDT0330169.1 condensation domain-containing protein [Nocardiopsis sp. DSM 44743]